MRWSGLLRTLLVLALTGGFLAIWLSRVDLAAMGHALANARAGLVAAVALLSLSHLLLRAIRWRALLAGAGWDGAEDGDDLPDGPERLSLRDLTSYTALGYLVSFVAPGRLGEIVRPALLWTRHRVAAGTALASIAFERMLDLAVIVLFLAAFLALEPDLAGPRVAKGAAIAGGAVILGGGGVVLLHRFRRPSLERLVRRLARLLPERFAAPVERLGTTFLAGFDALHEPGAWWRLPALSLVTWAPIALAMHLSLLATNLTPQWSAALLLIPVSAAGIAVPTPAGVGSYHAALTWALVEILAHPEGASAAAAVVAHAATILPVIAAGLYCLWREGLGLGSLKSVAARARPEAPDDAKTDADADTDVETDEGPEEREA